MKTKEEETDDMMFSLMLYIKPHIEIAFEGKRNGHNFNSYLPKNLKPIPNELMDALSTSIAILSVNYKSVSKWYFDFIDDHSLKTYPGGCSPNNYYGWMIYGCLKSIKAYLNKL